MINILLANSKFIKSSRKSLKFKSILYKNLIDQRLCCFSIQDKKYFNQQVNLKQQEQAIVISDKQHQMMEKKYQQVEVKSLNDRVLTNLNDFQRQIIKQNKFDLSDPLIKPKMMTISSIPGLIQRKNIAQISLGNIKVKAKNQVFLSQIDANNIPQDYNIRFDSQKQLVLVGRKLPSSGVNSSSSQMSISTSQSFQQQTLSQISEKYMGQIGYKYQFNRKRSFRQSLLAIPIFWLIIYPIFQTLDETYQCLYSIKEIQQEQMKQVNKIKRNRMVKVLLQSKDFYYTN